MNCFHLLTTKNHINKESHKKVCENKDFCGVALSFKDTKILEFNQFQKSDKIPSILYADLESFIKKVNGCKNIPEKLSITKTVARIR